MEPYIILDLWSALGGSYTDFDGYLQQNGRAGTWATLLHAVRKMNGETECMATGPDWDGPCVLLKPRTAAAHVHYGQSDVGRSEPLPFLVPTPNDWIQAVEMPGD